RVDVVFVHRMRFEVALRATRELRAEAPPLLIRIVELAERVRDLETADVQLETLYRVPVVRLLLRERRHLRRKIVDERRLNQALLAHPPEDPHRDLAGAEPGLDLHADRTGDLHGLLATAEIVGVDLAMEPLRCRLRRRTSQRYTRVGRFK